MMHHDTGCRIDEIDNSIFKYLLGFKISTFSMSINQPINKGNEIFYYWHDQRRPPPPRVEPRVILLYL